MVGMTEVYIGNIASSRQRSQVNEDVVCTLKLPSKLLDEWKRKINKGTATSFVSQLNENVKGKIVEIADGERANMLEGRLGRKAGEIETELRVKKRRRETTLQKEVSFKLMKEVVSLDDIEDQYRYYTCKLIVLLQGPDYSQQGPNTGTSGKNTASC